MKTETKRNHSKPDRNFKVGDIVYYTFEGHIVKSTITDITKTYIAVKEGDFSHTIHENRLFKTIRDLNVYLNTNIIDLTK